MLFKKSASSSDQVARIACFQVNWHLSGRGQNRLVSAIRVRGVRQVWNVGFKRGKPEPGRLNGTKCGENAEVATFLLRLRCYDAL